MAKYRYRVEAGRYGGECAIGSVTDEFARYWATKLQDESAHESFIPHLLALGEWEGDDEDIDSDSPDIFEDGNEVEGWYAIDDIEHINGAFADGGFFVSSIPADGSDDWAWDDDEQQVEAYWLKGREGGYFSTDPEGETPEGCTPVVAFMSVEKGGFQTWFIDTDEPFDESKLVMTINETNMGEFVEDLAYDRVWLEANYDQNDTTGKSYEAEVGWITDQWREHYVDPEEDEGMGLCWEDYEESQE